MKLGKFKNRDDEDFVGDDGELSDEDREDKSPPTIVAPKSSKKTKKPISSSSEPASSSSKAQPKNKCDNKAQATTLVQSKLKNMPVLPSVPLKSND